jgi:lipoate-protein ligase B
MLIDLRSRELEYEGFVDIMNSSVLEYLSTKGIEAHADENDPGIYNANGEKLCSYGFKYRRGVLTGGMSINMHVDLAKFSNTPICSRNRSVANIFDQPMTWPMIVAESHNIVARMVGKLQAQA